MKESLEMLRELYCLERQCFADLEIPLDEYWAAEWLWELKMHFGVFDVGFRYHHKKPQDRLVAGSTHPINLTMIADEDTRIALITLYPPHSLRTLGHEFCHALRWMRDGVQGHGGRWCDDLTAVHTHIRSQLDRLRPQSVSPALMEARYQHDRDPRRRLDEAVRA